MKKVLLIGDSPLSDSPYIMSYMEVLEQNNIPYDLLFWNRHLDSTELLPGNYIPYNRFTDNKYPFWKKVIKINGFARFVKKHLATNEYCYVVVFTIANAVFMSSVLRKRYKRRYVFDIRDHSPLCKIGIIQRIIDRLVENSSFSVVSSAGFLHWLPKGDKYRYIVAHNTTMGMIDKYIERNNAITPNITKDVLSILTIGQIRDYNANVKLMEALKKEKLIRMVYAGYGLASDDLIKYAKEHHVDNVNFTGRYKKSEEESIVMEHHMINGFMNRDINSDSLMSNRFYLSVLMRKPLIVRKGSYQAELVERYGLGVVLDEVDNFVDRIIKWWQDFDGIKYEQGCRDFLESVRLDTQKFEQQLLQLYEISSNQ